MATLNQGIYADIPIEDYIRDPAPEPSLSTGSAQALIDECPRRAWHNHPRLNPKHESEDNGATDLGKLAHAMLLEDDTSRLVIAPFPDWRTKAAKELRDAARAEGKIPILESKVQEVAAMVGAAREAFSRAAPELGSLTDARKEQTLIWQESGVWCRSRPDILMPGGLLAVDFKTTATSVHPDALARFVCNQGWDLQAALIRAGMHALTGKTPDVVFAVQEVEPPYLMSFIGLDPTFAAIADKKLERAVQLWAECLKSNRWPGYPDRVAWVSPPPWEIAKAESILER